MAAFEYTAVSESGKKVTGIEEADSLRQVRQILRDRRLMPIEVSEAANTHKSSQNQGQSGLNWFSGSISSKNLALLTRQLATLIQSGLPVDEALKAVAKQTVKSSVQSVLLAVRSKILEGYALAHAMNDYPRAFPKLYRATVSAGEHSGHLGKVMEQLADHTESASELQQSIRMAMVYPVLLMVFSLLIVTGLMVYVVPDVIKVFVDGGQALPPLTQALVNISDVLSQYGLLILIALTALGLLFTWGIQKPKFRKVWHRFLLKIPLIRTLIIVSETSRFGATLSILCRSGVPLADALTIASEVLNNESLSDQMETVEKKVLEGGSLSQSLEEISSFPPMMVHMIASGESSGELTQMLTKASDYQSRELKSLVTNMVKLFEPLLLVVMGGVVLLIVMAILLPILNMNQMVF